MEDDILKFDMGHTWVTWASHVVANWVSKKMQNKHFIRIGTCINYKAMVGFLSDKRPRSYMRGNTVTSKPFGGILTKLEDLS